MIAGDILIIGNGRDPIQHNGVHLLFDGMVNINLSSKNVGVFEAFYNSAKVIFRTFYSQLFTHLC